MEIEALIKKMKDIYSPLIDFIEATDDQDAEFQALIEVLEKHEILENKDEVRLLFQLISKISDNHHRTSDFFDKLSKIFQYLIKDIPSTISDFIPDYTKYNKRIVYFLLEKGFVKPDKPFLNQYLNNRNQSSISNPNNTISHPFSNPFHSTKYIEKNSKFSYSFGKPFITKSSSADSKKEPDMAQTFYYLYPKIKEFLDEKL